MYRYDEFDSTLVNERVEQFRRQVQRRLKGELNDVAGGPTIRYYVMGAIGEPDSPGNSWREASDWPVPTEQGINE